jgi:hypothetical protein
MTIQSTYLFLSHFLYLSDSIDWNDKRKTWSC